MFRRKPKTPPCKHLFEVAGVQSVELFDVTLSREQPVSRHTDALSVCAWCGSRKVERLRGHWTLEQVRGLNPTQEPSEV